MLNRSCFGCCILLSELVNLVNLCESIPLIFGQLFTTFRMFTLVLTSFN